MTRMNKITSKIGYGYFVAISMAAMSYLTCSAGNHDILDAQPEPPFAPCTPGETRHYYPSDGGLVYSDNALISSCTSGTLTCKNLDDGATAWDETIKPYSSSKGPEICNGKDDDCNGIVDDANTSGTPCVIGPGACATAGKLKCTLTNTMPQCDGIPLASAPPGYYAYPFTRPRPEPRPDWNWDCDNGGAIDTGFVNSTSISPTNYNATESSIIATASINQIQASAITSTPATLCSMNKLTWYDSTGADKYNIVRSGTLPPSSTECGKSFIAVKCTGTTTISGSFEIVTVVCK